MMMFVVTPVVLMEGINISEEQAACFFRVEARYKCGGLDT
jgi:hypothetical protein